jgi:putative two-component system response regulator
MKNTPVILIVDDQHQNIELLEALLVPQGYEVIKAANGAEALKSLSNNPIDLILLDVMMPKMDGFDVTRKIRQDKTYQLLPIILVTALRNTEDRVKGIEAGCDDFISKPFDKSELYARIRSLLKVKAYNDLMINYQKELEFEIAKETEELRKALDRTKSASLETIHCLSKAAEYKDEDTAAHIQRMSFYAEAVAKKIGLSEIETENLLYAAPMHDIGKIGVPDHILLKPEKLNDEEWVIMRQHTTFGANILSGSNSEFIKLGSTIALSHHEKWDGTGYPKNLKGDEIPLPAKICAIADVFDALTSHRPYRKEPFSIEESFYMIKEGIGSQFDPDVADTFFSIKDQILQIKDKFIE